VRADARRNRTLVLDAAAAAFAEVGVSVSLDEIARRAGVGAGTVYRHFPTKKSLFEAIVLASVLRLIEEARTQARADDPGAAFFSFLAMLADQSTHRRDFVDALTDAGVDVMSTVAGATRELHEAVGELLTRAQRTGAVRANLDATDLMIILKGLSLAIQQSGAADRAGDGNGSGSSAGEERRARVFAVLRDGLREPQG
jgi:AcrR family transcriptional regulator